MPEPSHNASAASDARTNIGTPRRIACRDRDNPVWFVERQWRPPSMASLASCKFEPLAWIARWRQYAHISRANGSGRVQSSPFLVPFRLAEAGWAPNQRPWRRPNRLDELELLAILASGLCRGICESLRQSRLLASADAPAVQSWRQMLPLKSSAKPVVSESVLI
jgi:hypothetical protein